MKISSVRCWVLRIPVEYPLLEKARIHDFNLVEIQTDDHINGYSLSTYPMAFGMKDFINRDIEPLLLGKDPLRIEEILSSMFVGLSRKYFAGSYGNCISLLDIALWDIKGKAANQPVWKMLGGARKKVPAYITFGLGIYSQEQLVEVAKTLVAQGQKALKMVVAASSSPQNHVFGRPTNKDIERDIDRVCAVREAIGNGVELMIDANKNPTLSQILFLAKNVEHCNLTWLEDPLVHADPLLLRQLREKTSIPIAAGSSGTSDIFHIREYLLNNAVDYLQPNVRDIGGYTGGLKAAGMAQAFNVEIQMGGNWPHINMHLHAGVPNGGRVEFHWQGWQIGKMVFEGAIEPVNGYITMPEIPGVGLTPHDGVIEQYAMEEVE